MFDMQEQAETRRQARKPIPKPKPAYLPTAGSPLSVDEGLYTRIRDAPRLKNDEFVIPIRSGRAWKAEAGCIVRISTPNGPQVGKFKLTNTAPMKHSRLSSIHVMEESGCVVDEVKTHIIHLTMTRLLFSRTSSDSRGRTINSVKQ
jgi:uncharacterized protein YcgI (DUF1989 family)